MEFSVLFPLRKQIEAVTSREAALPKGFVAIPQAIMNSLTPEQISRQQEIYRKVYEEARAAAAGWQLLPRREWPRAARN